MLDENLIATLETSLRQTRNAQNRLIARLNELETESRHLREEIQALENSALQTESAIDSLLVNLRSGSRSFVSRPSQKSEISSEKKIFNDPRPDGREKRPDRGVGISEPGDNVAFLNNLRGVPSRNSSVEPLTHRFSDRTITQACTLLLREAGKPLHVNELYNLLVSGGMEFKGNNPTISIAVSLNRNRRFRKVDPGTFDLAMREASRFAS